MSVKHKFWFPVIIAALVLAAGLLLHKGQTTPVTVNKENIRTLPPLPTLYFYDDQEQKRTLADFSGQVVLVNLWATWCPPCVVELPSLDTLQAKLHTQPFKVVAISMDRSSSTLIRKFLDVREIEYLDLYWDKDNQIPLKWKYSGLPSSFLLDKKGNVVRQFDGPYEWDKGEIFEEIKALTASP